MSFKIERSFNLYMTGLITLPTYVHEAVTWPVTAKLRKLNKRKLKRVLYKNILFNIQRKQNE